MAVSTCIAGEPRNIGADTTLDMRTGAAIDQMGGQARLTIMWTVPGPRLRLALRIAAVWSLLWPLFGLLFLMVVLEQVPLGSRFNVSLASASSPRFCQLSSWQCGWCGPSVGDG